MVNENFYVRKGASADSLKSVVLILNYPPDGQESMLRFGDALYTALKISGVNIDKWRPPQLLGRLFRVGGGGLLKWLGYLDKFVFGILSLLMYRARHPGAIWHIVDHSNSLYCWVLPKKRTITTCHDCIAIDDALSGRTGEKVSRFGRIFQKIIAKGMTRCAKVVCVSEATAADLERLVGISACRSRVIHNGLLMPYTPVNGETALFRLQIAGIPTDKPFIFMIGSNLIRKNRIGAIEIFCAFRDMLPDRECRLVLAGRPWSFEVAKAVQSSKYARDIVEAGRLSDEALEAAYSHAAAVIFPSLAEGFGLPVVEAQACGAVVVASDIQPMPEIGGKGALYENPLDATKFARAIYKAIGLDHQLRRNALENAKRFDTIQWATRYAETYCSMTPEKDRI